MRNPEKREAWEKRRREESRKAYAALMKFYPFGLDDLDGEEWREFDDNYHVSNFGRVKSFSNGAAKILKPLLRGVSLYFKFNRQKVSISRLVAEKFLANEHGKPQVAHRDGCRFNNYVGNLMWCTQSENQQNIYDLGLEVMPQGADHHLAKLTNEQIEYIRANPDALIGKEIARKYGIGETTVSAIQLGRTYRNAGGAIRKTKRQRVPDEMRRAIRAEYQRGGVTTRALAAKYDIGKTTIWNIVK